MGLLGPNIKKMEKKGDIEGLIKALQHEKCSTREKSTLALERLGWKPQEVEEKAWYLAGKRAWQKLAELGAAALAPLVAAAQHQDSSERLTVWSVLEKSAFSYKDDALPLLCDLLSDSVKRLNEKTTETRIKTVQLIGKLGDESTVLPLILSIGKLSDTFYAIPSDHRKPYEHINRDYYNVIMRAIQAIGDPAIDTLYEILTTRADEYKSHLNTLISILSSLGPNALEPLKMLLDHENPDVRSSAIWGFDKFEDDTVVESLTKALKDMDCNVRTSAACVLKNKNWQPNIPEEKAYFLLAEILQSNTTQGNLSKAKQDTLTSMKDLAVKPLVSSLNINGQVHTRLPYKNTVIQVPARNVVIEVLAAIGQPAISALEEACNDPDPVVQKSAQDTLSRLK